MNDVTAGGAWYLRPVSQRAAFLSGAVVICAVGVAVYGRHVLRGGFAADDWVDYSRYLFHPGRGFWAAVAYHAGAYRPLWAILSDLGWAVMGANPTPHLLQGLVVGLVESMLLLAVARYLEVPLVSSLAMALMLLIFPDADATRLFASDSQMALASALLLGGFLLGLHGADAVGRKRESLGLGVLAVLLYALSVLDYELTAPPALLAGAVCVLRAWRRGTGWPMWAGIFGAEFLLVAALLVHRVAGHAPHTTPAQDLSHARLIAIQGVTVAARATFPVTAWLRPAVFPVVGAVCAVGIVVAPIARGGYGRSLRRDMLGLALGCLVVATGYVMIIPGSAGYMPDSAGMQNRINAVAAIGFPVALVSLISFLVTILTGWSARTRPAAAALLIAAAGWVVAGYAARTSQHAAHWERAAREQSEILAILDRAVPAPRDGLTVFAFGRSGYTAPAVPIFGGGGMGDMVGALRVTWHTGSTRGYPVLDQMHVDCQGSTVLIDGIRDSRTPYGHIAFVDLRHGSASFPADARQCHQAASTLPYAPVNETEISDQGSPP